MTATSIKISQLPSASTPLTGAEIMPLAKNRQNVKVGIGAVQIPQPLGDLPANTPVGTLGYIVDAAGGPRPGYSNGTGWQQFGGNNDIIKTMGPGLWVVGVGRSVANSPAHLLSMFDPKISTRPADQGWYFYSVDGQIWTAVDVAEFNRAFTATAYANGCFLLEGLAAGDGGFNSPIVATIRNPMFPNDPDDGLKLLAPRGYSNPSEIGVVPLPLTEVNGGHYDNDTGIFTVPFQPDGSQPVQNTLCPALVPNPNWPSVGQDSFSFPIGFNIVEGMGTKGPVDVRMLSTNFIIPDPVTLTEEQIFIVPGNYLTNFLEWSPAGSSNWQAVQSPSGPPTVRPGFTGGPVLSGNSQRVAGLTLRGLVWGPVAQRAVLCLPGNN